MDILYNFITYLYLNLHKLSAIPIDNYVGLFYIIN
nr:MAG TPA_asm: hypothetical protein [Caudoviricetes sp.]DAV04391.1 MAG TPA: hypothetical protein [Caudoviricetes sp.]